MSSLTFHLDNNMYVYSGLYWRVLWSQWLFLSDDLQLCVFDNYFRIYKQSLCFHGSHIANLWVVRTMEMAPGSYWGWRFSNLNCCEPTLLSGHHQRLLIGRSKSQMFQVHGCTLPGRTKRVQLSQSRLKNPRGNMVIFAEYNTFFIYQ